MLVEELADQWDSYAEMADSPTAGLKMPVVDQMRLVDEECGVVGRDPAELRRSTWTTGEALESVAAYHDYVRSQLDLGFTDVSVLLPEQVDVGVLRSIAGDVLPEFRARGKDSRARH